MAGWFVLGLGLGLKKKLLMETRMGLWKTVAKSFGVFRKELFSDKHKKLYALLSIQAKQDQLLIDRCA